MPTEDQLIPIRLSTCTNQLSRWSWCGKPIMSDDDDAMRLESGEELCGGCVDKLLTVERDGWRPLKAMPPSLRRKPMERNVRRGWTL